MKCPCCGGTGEVDVELPVRLTPTQRRIWDALRHAPHGLTITALAERVYTDADGGPEWALNCISVHAHHANKRLAVAGMRITASKGHGSVYRLEKLL